MLDMGKGSQKAQRVQCLTCGDRLVFETDGWGQVTERCPTCRTWRKVGP